jgi:hypothetical protein
MFLLDSDRGRAAGCSHGMMVGAGAFFLLADGYVLGAALSFGKRPCRQQRDHYMQSQTK